MAYKPKIQRARFVFSPFSSEQMAQIGQIMCDVITRRIKSGTNGNDDPAKPLVPGRGRNEGRGYPQRKIKRGLAPIRDWTFTGRTLGMLKVKRASENQVTIGFIDDKSDLIAHVNNLRERAFTTSPKDHDALNAAVRATLRQARVLSFRRVA